MLGYRKNCDAIDAIEMAKIPATIEDALGEVLSEPHSTVASYGGTGQAMHHGYGSKADERDKDRDRYFHTVDSAIVKHLSEPSGMPLILAALPEYHTHFRQGSKNRFLLDQGIAKNPKSMDVDALRREAWALMEPYYLQRLAEWIDRYQAARARQHASDDLSDVARAAAEGRVDSLLIEAGREVPGKIDAASGAISTSDLEDPMVDDQLDDLAEMVLKAKGEVIVAPRDRMPSDSGLAAIYRY